MFNTRKDQSTEEFLDCALERITTDLDVLNTRKDSALEAFRLAAKDLELVNATLSNRCEKFQEMIDFIQEQHLATTKEIEKNEEIRSNILRILGE